MCKFGDLDTRHEMSIRENPSVAQILAERDARMKEPKTVEEAIAARRWDLVHQLRAAETANASTLPKETLQSASDPLPVPA